MEIRRVQSIHKEITSGGEIQVNITDDIDLLDNKDKVIAIGSKNTIRYEFKNLSELMAIYFMIIEKKKYYLIKLLEKQTILKKYYIPIFGFLKICPDLKISNKFNPEETVTNLLTNYYRKNQQYIKELKNYKDINNVNSDGSLSANKRKNLIFLGVYEDIFSLDEMEDFLKNYSESKDDSWFHRLLCVYDYKKYGTTK